MGKTLLVVVLLVLFNSCYTYKKVESKEPDYVIGQKYEIRIADRQLERVVIKDVTDSTLVVKKGKTELTVRKDMITESKYRKTSPGKTVAGVLLGGLLSYAILGIFSLTM